MIQELLDFADALELRTPMPLERRKVHYFLDLDLNGTLIGISPTCGSTKSGKEELGKEFECPVFFPLKLNKAGEIISNGGGGKPVAEFLTGDTMEIFGCRLEENGHCVPIAGTKDEERRPNWLRLHNLLLRNLRYSKRLTRQHEAVWQFVRKPKSLEECLPYFYLPDPEREARSASTEDEKKKLKDKAEKARKAMLKRIGDPSTRFSFRVLGSVALKDSELTKVQRKYYDGQRRKVVNCLLRDGFQGVDGYVVNAVLSAPAGCLTPVFPHIAGVPVMSGGPNNWCPLASFDKAPFKSYGLDSRTLPMRLETAERAAAALNYLLRHPDHHLRLGKVVAVFWAVTDTGKVAPLDFVQLMEQPDALEVRQFFQNISGHAAASPQSGKFYCAVLSSPKARITVRAWHTEVLPEVSANVEKHFKTVEMPDLNERGERKVSTLTEMAQVTVSPDAEDPPLQTTVAALFNAALFGRKEPLPDDLLAKVVERQAVELAAGHENNADAQKKWHDRLRHRAALIQLYFNLNKGISMNQETVLSEKCKDPAILCGRLLALLDKIHGEAHVQRDEKGKVVSKGTASSPANRFYRAASKTPALVFPRLLDLARDHLAKIDKDWAYRLEFGWRPEDSDKLEERISQPGAEEKPSRAEDKEDSDKLKERISQPFIGLAGLLEQLKLKNQGEFPRLFNLEQQGRFALGFYYERCREWPKPKESKTKSNDNPNND